MHGQTFEILSLLFLVTTHDKVLTLKIIYFNTTLILIYLIVSNFVIDITTLKFKLPITILILGANVVFLVADFIISLLIQEINEKYLKKLKF